MTQIRPSFVRKGLRGVLLAWVLVAGGAFSPLPTAEAFFLIVEEDRSSAPPEPFSWRRIAPLDDVERLFREGGFLTLCESGSSADVAAALLRGADPNLSNDRGRSALMFAMANADPSVVALLLERGADPRATDREGHPVWMFRTPHHAPGTLALLLDFGMDLRQGGASGIEMPFLLAAASDAPATLPLLVARGMSVELRDAAGATLLMWAATSSQPGGVRALLDMGANPRAQDREGRTPLHHALESPFPSPEVLRALLRGGADPNARTADGVSPLALAARQGHPQEIFQELLRGGALPALADADGITPCDEGRTNPTIRHDEEILRLLCGDAPE